MTQLLYEHDVSLSRGKWRKDRMKSFCEQRRHPFPSECFLLRRCLLIRGLVLFFEGQVW